jgi:hypothetical protein
MISHENKHFALEHLTPMITSPISPEKSDLEKGVHRRERATAERTHLFGHWDLLIGRSKPAT